MAGIVSFHAHPDDESISTGGFLARAAAAGERVTLVFATRGEHGNPVPGVLRDGEQLTLRRTAESHDSAGILGVERVEFLGFTDSDMAGSPANDDPWSFWRADIEHAAARLAVILEEEQPDILTIYDDIGGYGHPDHIQVHRVGRRAGELAGVPVIAQATINRDLVDRALAAAEELGVSNGPETDRMVDKATGREAAPEIREGDDFGKREDEITHFVDVGGFLAEKRASMRAHASQIGPDHFMSTLPDDAFAFVFGTEWFIIDPVPEEPPPLFEALFQPLTGPAEDPS